MPARLARFLFAGAVLCAARASGAQEPEVVGASAGTAPIADTTWRVLVPRTVGMLLADPPAPRGDMNLSSPGLPNVVSPPARSPDQRWAPAFSAALPGAGQARLGQDRFVGYLAVEGFLWLRYFTDRREGIRQRNAYRDVALDVSRAPFGGPKPTGDFEYYERMEHWIASGVFDADPALPGIDPETDTTTFNGATWLLARRTYWTRPDLPPPVGSPAYLAALSFYEQSAVRPGFEWSWRGARLEQDIYRRHIRKSNDAFRRAISDVSIVIANHVLSTVDAYISLRLRLRAEIQPGAPSNVGFSASIPWATLGGPVHAEPQSPRSR